MTTPTTDPAVAGLAVGLSRDALNELVRAIADRGEDFGWDVYREGFTADYPHPLWSDPDWVALQDEGFTAWAEAFTAAYLAYRLATGEDWRY